jgi:hypothetical protein
VVVFLSIVFFNTQTIAAKTLSWDSTDEPDIKGWVIFFSDDNGQSWYNKYITLEDVVDDGTTINYVDVESKLNLQFDTQYLLKMTAIDDHTASSYSESITLTRESFSVPLDNIPATTIIELKAPARVVITITVPKE